MITPHNPALWLVLLALAVYRMAYLTSTDQGPWRIFSRARAWVLARWGPESWQYEGATCLFCQSVWYAALAALAYELGLEYWPVRLVILWLALAGAALIVHWLILTWMAKVQVS